MMTPTDYDLQLDVTIVDDEGYEDCSGFGLLPCTRAPAKTVQIPPIVLEKLVLESRG